MEANRIVLVLMLCTLYLLRDGCADINPLTANYEATIGTNLKLIWNYDYEVDAFNVEWSFKNKTSSSPSPVMVKITPAAASVVEPNFNIKHESNGNVTIEGVKMDNEGTYYCSVEYTAAKYPPVIGTAVVTIATSNDVNDGLSAGEIAGIVIGSVGGAVLLVGAAIFAYFKCKGDKGDTSRDVESTRSSPEKAKNKLLNEKKQVHPDSEGKKPFRPQPSPPPEANINHSSNPDKHKTGHVSAGSGLPAIQGADNGPSLTKKTDPLPPIGGTPRTDKTY